jgi:hypothetical protein
MFWWAKTIMHCGDKQYGGFTSKLLHLLFGVLWIFGTLMEWNRRESHDCSELFRLPRFSSRSSQNRHVTLPIFTWLEMEATYLCIQCTLYRALFWRVNRYISTYTYMLFERKGWAKSTSKNVAKAYLDVQITANHYTLYYANN